MLFFGPLFPICKAKNTELSISSEPTPAWKEIHGKRIIINFYWFYFRLLSKKSKSILSWASSFVVHKKHVRNVEWKKQFFSSAMLIWVFFHEYKIKWCQFCLLYESLMQSSQHTSLYFEFHFMTKKKQKKLISQRREHSLLFSVPNAKMRNIGDV